MKVKVYHIYCGLLLLAAVVGWFSWVGYFKHYGYHNPTVFITIGVLPMYQARVEHHSISMGRIGDIRRIEANGTTYLCYIANPYKKTENVHLFICYEEYEDGAYTLRSCIPIFDVLPEEIQSGAEVSCLVDGSSIRVVRGSKELLEVASIRIARGE